jgi:hypothetical protein
MRHSPANQLGAPRMNKQNLQNPQQQPAGTASLGWPRSPGFRATEMALPVLGRSFHLRILITGVRGFIGSALAYAAHAQGHEVIGVDQSTNGRTLPSGVRPAWRTSLICQAPRSTGSRSHSRRQRRICSTQSSHMVWQRQWVRSTANTMLPAAICGACPFDRFQCTVLGRT